MSFKNTSIPLAVLFCLLTSSWSLESRGDVPESTVSVAERTRLLQTVDITIEGRPIRTFFQENYERLTLKTTAESLYKRKRLKKEIGSQFTRILQELGSDEIEYPLASLKGLLKTQSLPDGCKATGVSLPDYKGRPALFFDITDAEGKTVSIDQHVLILSMGDLDSQNFVWHRQIRGYDLKIDIDDNDQIKGLVAIGKGNLSVRCGLVR